MIHTVQFVAILLASLSMSVHFGTWLVEAPMREATSGARSRWRILRSTSAEGSPRLKETTIKLRVDLATAPSMRRARQQAVFGAFALPRLEPRAFRWMLW